MESPTQKPEVKIKQNEQNPEPIELIAQAIIDISMAFKKIENSPLKKRALTLLIQDACPGKNISMSAIETILNTIPELEKYYIKEQFLKKQISK